MTSDPIPTDLKSQLWQHQTKAIEFALGYLRDPNNASTVLVRMPTGTGKTGVIATLSVAVPPSGWTLVLTPWANLCKQMIDDVEKEFWENRWTPPSKPKVLRLYPSLLADMVAKKDAQLILVATFNTLVTIFKKQREKYNDLAKKLSQVIVDEGHYEPAVEWGQAVKNLKRPTLLLTATPYRNDLKLFRVNKDDVFHYTHQEAESEGIIRGVEFRKLGVEEPGATLVPVWCDAFAQFWKSRAKYDLHSEPRAIICCSKREVVERVTKLLRDRGVNALGIHERFTDTGRKKWLRQQTPKPESVDYDVWVHQNKLTEGLDDHRFCVLALLNRIKNDRKLVQQIGRVLRRTPQHKGQGKALVLYSDDIRVEQSWGNYRAFELQRELVDPERYTQVLEKLLTAQPEFEYFGNSFRRRFQTTSTDLTAQILLASSAVVRRIRPTFKFEEFVDFSTDFLLLEDFILLGPEPNKPLVGPNDSRLWVYASFGNSPLLMEHSQYEIRLGAMAAVKHHDFLFMVDSEGIYPVKYLSEHTKKIAPSELARIFGEQTVPKEVSITNPWPAGPAVRRSTVHADDLNTTPARLTDSAFFCASVRATVKPEKKGQPYRRHYVGFQRGRVSEQIQSTARSSFKLNEFVDWTKKLGGLIRTDTRQAPEFFKRYLSQVPAPTVVTPAFLIVNLFEGDVTLQDEAGETVEVIDSIVELRPDPAGAITGPQFQFNLRFRRLETDKETEVKGTLAYEPAAERFRIKGERLNSSILVDEDKDQLAGLATYLNHNDEAFTVALDGSDLYYTTEAFFKVDYLNAERRLASILTPDSRLERVLSEKGKPSLTKATWDRASIFGMIDDTSASGFIGRAFGPDLELLICDDMGKEVADFVCASFTKHRIVFIHAKHGKERKVSASALHDVVAQAMKNLGAITRNGTAPDKVDHWTRTAKWLPKTKIKRWRVGANNLPTAELLWQKIRHDILDHPDAEKEVWLVLGQTLEKAALMKQIDTPKLRDAVTGQIVHLLSGLQANCTQLGVKLRVFCH